MSSSFRLLSSRQSPLDHQPHGVLDRDANDARLLVRPAVALEQRLLPGKELLELLLRVLLKPRRRRQAILLTRRHRVRLGPGALVMALVHAEQPPQKQVND